MHSDPSDDLGQAQLGCSDLASMCREWSKHKWTAQSIVVNTYKIHRDAFTIRSLRPHLHSFRRCPQHWRAQVVPSCWKKCRANGGQNNMIKCPQVLPSQCPLCTLVPHRIQLVAVFFLFFCRCPSNISSLPLILGHTEGPPNLHETRGSHNSRQKGLHTVYSPFLFLNCKSHGWQKIKVIHESMCKKRGGKTIIWNL